MRLHYRAAERAQRRPGHGRRRVGTLWDFAGGRRGRHLIRRAAIRRRSPGTGQRALNARHGVTQYVQVATHFGHGGSERVDLAAQTRPLPFNLTAQGRPCARITGTSTASVAATAPTAPNEAVTPTVTGTSILQPAG